MFQYVQRVDHKTQLQPLVQALEEIESLQRVRVSFTGHPYDTENTHQDAGLMEVFQNQLDILQLDPFVDDVVDFLRPRFQPHMSPDKTAGRHFTTKLQRFENPLHAEKGGKLHPVFRADVFVGNILYALRG